MLMPCLWLYGTATILVWIVPKGVPLLVVVFICWQMLLPRWLMVLPLFVFGRCYCQMGDVFATVFIVHVGRCYCLVPDGMPTMHVDGKNSGSNIQPQTWH